MLRVRRRHVLPLLLGAGLMALGVALGNWQLRRAQEKTSLQQRWAAAGAAVPQDWQVARKAPAADDASASGSADWRKVRLAGYWVPEKAVLLDNRMHEGRPGYHVFMPLSLPATAGTAAEWVLVNRGWIAAPPRRDTLPLVATPVGTVSVEGMARVPGARPFTLADTAGQGTVWQYIDLDAYRAWSGLAVAGMTVSQTSSADDGLVRDWAVPDAGIDRHRGYAFQWYALAGLALVLTGRHLWRASNDAA